MGFTFSCWAKNDEIIKKFTNQNYEIIPIVLFYFFYATKS